MLPKIDLPTYDLPIPSLGITKKFRPFTVKEEKLLLMAAESKDIDQIIDTTEQVISNCILEEFDITSLPFFDIDYLFIALRAKSVSDTINMMFTCRNQLDSGDCNTIFDVEMDIANVELHKPDVSNKVELPGKRGIVLKYPTYRQMKSITSGNVMDKKIDLIAYCIDYVYDKDQVYKDSTFLELKHFVEGLTEFQFKQLERYVENFPSFVATAKKACPNCGFMHGVRHTKFNDFFLL